MLKKMMKRALVGLLAMMMLVQIACAETTASVSVARAAQDATGVVLYANLMDAAGKSSGEEGMYAPEDYSVTLGDGAMTIPADGVMKLGDASQGTHFVICVDISKSILKDQMTEITRGLNQFAQSVFADITVHDRVSLYSFGEDVKKLQDASASASEFMDSVKTLARTDDWTMLYKAIFAALETARATGENLPVNSMVILITDGTDDPNVGDEGMYTDASIQAMVEKSQVPIHTIAIRQEGEQALENLNRFAAMSGGSLNLVDANQVGAALNDLSALADSTVLVHVPMTSDMLPGGTNAQEFRLTLNSNGTDIQDALPHIFEVNRTLLPTPAPTMAPTPEPVATPSPTPLPTATPTPAPTTPPPTMPPATPEPTVEPTATPEPVPEQPAWMLKAKALLTGRNAWILYAAALLLVALLVLVILLIVIKSRGGKGMRDTVDSERRDVLNDGVRTVRGDSADTFGQGSTVRMDKVNTGSMGGSGTIRIDDFQDEPSGGGTIRIEEEDMGVTLTIEEQRNGMSQMRTVAMRDEIVVGRRKECGLCIDDGTVSGAHMKIYRQAGTLYVQDMNSQNGTRVNGERTMSACPLRSGDTVKVGMTTLKIYFEI